MTQGISEQLKKRLAQVLPKGYEAELARVVEISGKVQPVAELSDEDRAALVFATEQGITAGGPDPITDGKPTLMRVVAWMCHEGVNRNGDAFVAEELPSAAAKVTARNPLVMDWNHAAIVGGPGRIIGVWSKLDYAFDKQARSGQGAWGILAEGVMFAWAYPDIADTMLAEQERKGKVDFSMACIPSSVEFGEMDGKRAAILHNPIFFTLSALDVAPGDKDAIGVVKEGDNRDVVEEELRQQLTGASSVTANGVGSWTISNGITSYTLLLDPAPLMRTASMSIKLSATATRNEAGELEIVATAVDADGKELAKETFVTKTEPVVKAEVHAASEAKIAEQETLLEASKISFAELEATAEELGNQVTELQAQLDAKVAELAAAQAALAEIEAEKLALEQAKRMEKRMAELPESYREAHMKRDEARRAEIEAEWAKMSDEQWAAKLEDISLALPKGTARIATFLERSQREGLLPVAAAPAEVSDAQAIAERIHKFTRNDR